MRNMNHTSNDKCKLLLFALYLGEGFQILETVEAEGKECLFALVFFSYRGLPVIPFYYMVKHNFMERKSINVRKVSDA